MAVSDRERRAYTSVAGVNDSDTPACEGRKPDVFDTAYMSPAGETLSRRGARICPSGSGVALNAADNRNSRKCCEWLAEIGCEPRLFPEHDVFLEHVISAPKVWSLLVIDVDSIGGPEFAAGQAYVLRGTLPDIPIILLCKHKDSHGLGRETEHDECRVLAKPFFRGTLYAAVRDALAENLQQGLIPLKPRNNSFIWD